MKERINPGDLVYDLDAIVKAGLGFEPYRYSRNDTRVLARRALRRLTAAWRLAKRTREPVRLWIIVSTRL